MGHCDMVHGGCHAGRGIFFDVNANCATYRDATYIPTICRCGGVNVKRCSQKYPLTFISCLLGCAYACSFYHHNAQILVNAVPSRYVRVPAMESSKVINHPFTGTGTFLALWTEYSLNTGMRISREAKSEASPG